MPYITKTFRFESFVTTELKRALVRARIDARSNNWVCYIDVVEERTMNSKEADSRKCNTDEYAIVGRIKVMPNGNHQEL